MDNTICSQPQTTDFRDIKLLVYEWAAYMQSDLEQVLERMDISYDRFSYEFCDKYHDDYLKRFLTGLQDKNEYTALFSMNYWPVLADFCHSAGIPYIAWSYDCPIPFELNPSILHDTNRLFVFDRHLYQDAQQNSWTRVEHIPLAVNCERLDEIRLSSEDHRRYDTDLSFVGNLYSSDMGFYFQFLAEPEKANVEAVLEEQLRTYGQYFLDQVVTEDFARIIFSRIEYAGNPVGFRWEGFRALLERAMAREVTYRERTTLLRALSELFSVRLYSPAPVPDAPRIHHAGVIENGTAMIKAFKASKINLNITYKQIPSGIPLRVLDILGAGGFLLTNYQEELSEHLTPGEDFVYYDSMEDALEKADYYLSHEEERQRIAAHGHESVRAFSYEDRIRTILTHSLG